MSQGIERFMNQNEKSREESSQRKELFSWKEIADYLGVTVRTAQKWEDERNLPVRRLPGGRARVSAQVAELESWKNSKSKEVDAGTKEIEETVLQQPYPLIAKDTATLGNSRISVQSAGFEQAQPRWKVRWIFLGLAGLLGMGVLAALVLFRNQPGSPAQWKIANNTLVVSDDVGRVVWRKTFDSELDTGRYSLEEPVPDPTNVWFGDLEGDGTVETLFIQQKAAHYAESNALICFSDKGDEKWRFVPGRPSQLRHSHLRRSSILGPSK